MKTKRLLQRCRISIPLRGPIADEFLSKLMGPINLIRAEGLVHPQEGDKLPIFLRCDGRDLVFCNISLYSTHPEASSYHLSSPEENDLPEGDPT